MKKYHKKINLVTPDGVKVFEIKPKGRYIIQIPKMAQLERELFEKRLNECKKKFCPTARFLMVMLKGDTK